MKKVTIFLAAFVLLALMVVPAFAFGSVQGSVIDSKDLDPWAFGGEVWVINDATGAYCATGTLAVDGTFDLALDGSDDGLGQTTTSCVSSTDNFTVYIDFTCSITPAGCTAPYADPGTSSIPFVQNSAPFPLNLGFIKTGTGPTAVTLQNVTTDSNSTAIGIGFVMVMLAGASFVMFRRRETA